MANLKYKYAIGCLIQWYEVELVGEYLQSVKNSLDTVDNKENVIIDLYLNCSQALEKIDEDINNLQFKKLRNSWLVRLPLIDLAKYAVYFPVLGIIMYTSKGMENELTLSTYWALALLLITVPVTIYKIILAKRAMSFELPTLSILRYIFAGLVMSLFLYFYQELIPLTGTSVVSIILYIIPPGFISVLIYSVIVLCIDSFIRKSTIDVIRGITSKN